MFIYKNNDTFTVIQNPYDPVYGVLDKNKQPYSKNELLKLGFFVESLPNQPNNPQYEYIMRVNFESEMVYYDKIPIKQQLSEESKVDFITKELATNKLESMKLKGLLKKNAEEIAKTKIELMQLKGGLK
ncbi:TPA: hypothetical protein N2D60_003573 [Clostridium botulinum]|nr:hypothetical protein [Clostridium botulinum]